MGKPGFLYHASALTDIVEFEPQNKSPRFPGEENLVFATPHPEVASMFLRPKSIPTEICVYGQQYVVFINATQEEYLSQDKGGAIYTLPGATFDTSDTGMGHIEWTSKVSVRPISKMIFKNSLEAMDRYGVDRYFVNDKIMVQIRDNPTKALGLVDWFAQET